MDYETIIKYLETDKDTLKTRTYDKGTHYICKLPFKSVLESAYGKLKNEDVVITDERILHIAERRDEVSFDRIIKELRNVIKQCESIYDDSQGKRSPGVLMVRSYDDDKTIILVVSLSTICSKNANSVITGIMVGDKSIKRVIKKHKRIV